MYLENTHSPELLVYAGTPKDRATLLKSPFKWFYPELAKTNSIWDAHLFRNPTNPYTELESLISFNPSVYLGNLGAHLLMRRIGLPSLAMAVAVRTRSRRLHRR